MSLNNPLIPIFIASIPLAVIFVAWLIEKRGRSSRSKFPKAAVDFRSFQAVTNRLTFTAGATPIHSNTPAEIILARSSRTQGMDAKASAQRLIKGIAFHNKVCLFMAGPTDQATEKEKILLDILAALTVVPRCVDVSSDADMHLGLPQSEGVAELPYLYIDGIAFGNFSAILEAVQGGSLTDALGDAGIAIDASAAQSLLKP